jgi:hypothetical protein
VSKADLLVVGGPIHVHGLASKRRRTAAVENAHGDVVPGAGDGPGLRDWLADLPRVANAQAAAFDTRASGSHLLTGATSHGIARRLHGHGYKLLETELRRQEHGGSAARGRAPAGRDSGAKLANALVAFHHAAP